MKNKHPSRKTVIPPLTESELSRPRKGIDREVFRKFIRELKHDVAPGLGCLCNEHLLALIVNKNRPTTPEAADAVNNFHVYSNNVFQGQLPTYFYEGY